MPLQLVTLQPLLLVSYHVNVGEERLIAGVLHADPPRLEVVAEELGGCVRQQVVEREQGDGGGDLVLVVNVLKFCKEDTSGRTLLKQVPML